MNVLITHSYWFRDDDNFNIGFFCRIHRLGIYFPIENVKSQFTDLYSSLDVQIFAVMWNDSPHLLLTAFNNYMEF